MRKKNLFDLGRDIDLLLDEIIELEIKGELTDDHPILDELDKAFQSRGGKLSSYVEIIKEKTADAKYYRGRSKEYSDHARALENVVTRMKDTVKGDMQHHGDKVVQAGDHKIRLLDNNTATLTVNVDAEDLPPAFQKVEIKADTDAIRGRH